LGRGLVRLVVAAIPQVDQKKTSVTTALLVAKEQGCG